MMGPRITETVDKVTLPDLSCFRDGDKYESNKVGNLRKMVLDGVESAINQLGGGGPNSLAPDSLLAGFRDVLDSEDFLPQFPQIAFEAIEGQLTTRLVDIFVYQPVEELSEHGF